MLGDDQGPGGEFVQIPVKSMVMEIVFDDIPTRFGMILSRS